MSDQEPFAETGEREKPGDTEGLLKRLRDWEAASRAHQSAWQRNARHWYNFTSGEQWTPEDKAKLIEEMRVPITFNRVDPMVSAVMGAEVLNRQSVQYYPREIGDSQASELLGAAADWVRDNCDAEDEESDAFADLVICGMGWTETLITYDSDAEGEVCVNRTDPLEMGWDPGAKKRNLADARYVFRIRDYDRDDFRAKFPDKLDEVIGQQADSPDGESGGPHWNAPFDQYRVNQGEQQADRRKIRVVQMQWWDLEPAYAVQDPQSGQIKDMEPAQLSQMVMLHLQAGMTPPQVAKGMRRVHKQAIYAGTTLVEQKPLPCGFTLHCMTGKRDRNTNTWYGLVKAMVDPQMWSNKWLSQLLHIVNSNAKGGLLYETGAFPNQKRAEDDWGRPDAMIEVTPGVIAGGKLRERTPGAIPPGLQALMEFSIESLPQVSGINLEMLGLVQREQAGVLEAQRKRSGYAILAVFFDALRRYRKMQGRVLLEFIQRYISDGRLIRIKGEAGAMQYVPLVRQPGTSKYDIVVDEAPMSANQKEAVWGMLVQMLPILKDMPIAPDVIAKMIEYSPLPASLSAQIAKSITQPQPNPAADMQQQMVMADAQAEIDNKQANAALTAAKTQKEIVETHLLPVDRAITARTAQQKAQPRQAA